MAKSLLLGLGSHLILDAFSNDPGDNATAQHEGSDNDQVIIAQVYTDTKVAEEAA